MVHFGLLHIVGQLIDVHEAAILCRFQQLRFNAMHRALVQLLNARPPLCAQPIAHQQDLLHQVLVQTVASCTERDLAAL